MEQDADVSFGMAWFKHVCNSRHPMTENGPDLVPTAHKTTDRFHSLNTTMSNAHRVAPTTGTLQGHVTGHINRA